MRELIFIRNMTEACVLAVVLLLAGAGCAAQRSAAARTYAEPETASEAQSDSPADSFLDRQVGDMADEDQRRAAEALDPPAAEPKPPRDKPLRPVRKRR